MDLTIEKAELKELIKEALAEIIAERNEDFCLLVREALEDRGMGRAIEEGMQSSEVDYKEMMSWLDQRI